ncbi:MAG TPA: hypothetical protein VJ249_04950 [Candidatus Bathyarchaeia archaeon]|nr:hypothetical protein [Candidatus Bathyarchaeia archaeon]
MVSPLDNWKFLVGEWKGETKGQYGETEIIKGTAVYSCEPSDSFIMERREAWSGNKPVNRSIGIMFFDGNEQKFKRKTFFSYGFVNNEVEYLRNENEIRFDITMEPLSKSFQGTRWRSFIKKISADKVAVGLEMAKEGEEFKSYGETTMIKTKC